MQRKKADGHGRAFGFSRLVHLPRSSQKLPVDRLGSTDAVKGVLRVIIRHLAHHHVCATSPPTKTTAAIPPGTCEPVSFAAEVLKGLEIFATVVILYVAARWGFFLNPHDGSK